MSLKGKPGVARLVVLLAFAAALAVAGLLSVPAQGARQVARDNSATLTDPTGDVEGQSTGPDIVSVALHDDGNLLNVAVTTAAPLAPDSLCVLYLDSDQNPATGDPSGSDYAFIFALLDGGQTEWALEQWDGGAFDAAPGSAAQQATISGNSVDFQLARADLGGGAGFNYWTAALATDSSGALASIDVAPDGILSGGAPASYQFAPGSTTTTSGTTTTATTTTATTTTATTPSTKSSFPRASFLAAHASPSTVRAGHRESVVFPVKMSDGAALDGDASLSTRVTLAGKPLAHTAVWRNGTVRVGLTVPKKSKGKLLVVKVSISAVSPVGPASRSAGFRVH